MLKWERVLFLMGVDGEEINYILTNKEKEISADQLFSIGNGSLVMRIFPNLNDEEKDLLLSVNPKYFINNIHFMFHYSSDSQKSKIIEIIKGLREDDKVDNFSTKARVIIDVFGYGNSSDEDKLLEIIGDMDNLDQRLMSFTYISSRCNIDQKLKISELLKLISTDHLREAINHMPNYIQEDLLKMYNLFSVNQQVILREFGIWGEMSFTDLVKVRERIIPLPLL